MKHDVTFVTAIYDDLSETEFNGRHNRGTHYAFSLAQMHNMGSPIYCFTDHRNFNKFFPALYHRGVENFKFVNYDLKQYPLHEKIQEVKTSKPTLYRDSPAWRTRCVEIMWGKFDWLKHVIEQVGIADDKVVYWIDAGLSHPGVLPNKFNTTYDKNTKYANSSIDYIKRFEFDAIFNDRLPDYLVEYGGLDKLLFFFCTNPQHSDPSHLPKLNYKVGTAVGGLFGGNTQLLYDWVCEAIQICNELVENAFLIKEEDILSHMINKHFQEETTFTDHITTYDFYTWYHEDWLNDWNPDLYDPSKHNTFADFFNPFIEHEGAL